jgi:hypothetical protein
MAKDIPKRVAACYSLSPPNLDTLQQNTGRPIVRILWHEFAPEGFAQNNHSYSPLYHQEQQKITGWILPKPTEPVLAVLSLCHWA